MGKTEKAKVRLSFVKRDWNLGFDIENYDWDGSKVIVWEKSRENIWSPDIYK